jgi:hypothetical protein
MESGRVGKVKDRGFYPDLEGELNTREPMEAGWRARTTMAAISFIV